MFFTPFERMIAFRYLRSRKAEGFVSVIAAFSFLGIMLGVAALIIVMSVMNGFRAELITRMLGLNGHLNVYAQNGPLLNYLDMAERLRQIPGIVSVSPMVEGQALLSTAGGASGVMVRGFDPTDFARKPIISTSIVDGSLNGFGGTGVAIGVKLAERFNLRPGDNLTLIAPKGKAGPFGTIPRSQTFTVSSVFDVGMFEFNSGFVFMPLEAAQLFFQMPGAANSIEVITRQPDKLAPVKQAVATAVAGEAGVYDWQDTNKTFFGALKVESTVMFIILALINVIAGFNIISSMIMLVKDKTRDIAIMRTMGATSASIMRIFLLVGSSIGIAGTSAGIVLGVTIALNIEHIRNFIQDVFHTKLFPEDVYIFSRIPSILDPRDVFWATVLALGLSLFFTFFPARRAAKLDPVEAIRYE